jgi:type IV pilus assembly protein PilB
VAISQRLVRKLCQNCKVARHLSREEVQSLKELIPTLDSSMNFYSPKGCAECNNAGYRGRVAIHEVLEVKDEIQKLIMNRADANEIKEAAIQEGMTTMIDDALVNANKGLTSIEEILRVIHE